MTTVHDPTARDAVRGDLASATGARKCHGCGCFHDAVAALEDSPLRDDLAEDLATARRTFGERRYDCLGCDVCWPAQALNRAGEIAELPVSAGCPTDAPARRQGWPPLPGDYRVLTFHAPVAACTLHSRDLAEELAATGGAGLSIVGALQTENLGIERIVENVVANPHLRVLVVCGQDTAGRIGHYPGQSLIRLIEAGVDEDGRIVGAAGKRPILMNVDPVLLTHFRRQVQVLDRRGVVDAQVLARDIAVAAADAPGPMDPAPAVARTVRCVPAAPPDRLVLDPAGYVVVVPDRQRQLLVAEHYEKSGLLDAVVEGADGSDVVATLLREGLVTRADHAAYLGRELALAERALREAGPYRQDAAPGEAAAPSAAGSGCNSCGGSR